MRAIGDQKTCSSCGVTRAVEEFSKNRAKVDGLQNQCKRCHAAASRRYVKANAEKHAQAVRNWGQRNFDKRRAAGKRWRANHPEKRAAHIAVMQAVRSGALRKPAFCEKCVAVTDDLHAHHDNYELPTDVRWLCRKCHGAEHAGAVV